MGTRRMPSVCPLSRLNAPFHHRPPMSLCRSCPPALAGEDESRVPEDDHYPKSQTEPIICNRLPSQKQSKLLGSQRWTVCVQHPVTVRAYDRKVGPGILCPWPIADFRHWHQMMGLDEFPSDFSV